MNWIKTNLKSFCQKNNIKIFGLVHWTWKQPCNGYKLDLVILSKTKNFVVVENLGKEKDYLQRKEALEEGKKRVKKKEEAIENQPSEEKEVKETPPVAEAETKSTEE